MWLEHLFRLTYVFLYLLGTFICSLFGPSIGDSRHVVDPSSVFSFINYIFVSHGFLISFSIVTLLLVLNRLIGPGKVENREKIVEGLVALGATTYWALWRIFFVWLDQQSGGCRLRKAIERIAHDRAGCVEAGGYWDGLDISGHCFLIALACSFFYDQFADAISLLRSRTARPAGYRSTPQLESADSSAYGTKRKQVLLLLNISYAVLLLAAGIVWFSWTALLLHTSLYFHTLGEKMYGVLIGFAYWPMVLFARSRVSQSSVQ